jgi:hypothetical protein
VTAPGAGFRLDLDDLSALAAGTSEVAVRVRVAGGRARPIHVPSFGSVGATFGAAAAAAAATAGEAITDTADTVDRAADALRRTAEAYRSVERAATAAFDGLAR